MPSPSNAWREKRGSVTCGTPRAPHRRRRGRRADATLAGEGGRTLAEGRAHRQCMPPPVDGRPLPPPSPPVLETALATTGCVQSGRPDGCVRARAPGAGVGIYARAGPGRCGSRCRASPWECRLAPRRGRSGRRVCRARRGGRGARDGMGWDGRRVGAEHTGRARRQQPPGGGRKSARSIPGRRAGRPPGSLCSILCIVVLRRCRRPAGCSLVIQGRQELGYVCQGGLCVGGGFARGRPWSHPLTPTRSARANDGRRS